MKPSILLLAASALVAPLSAQESGPGRDLIDLFEKSQREGATDDELRQMLEDKARTELQVPELRDFRPASREDFDRLQEQFRKNAEQERFRPLLEGGEQRKPGRAKEAGEPRRSLETTEAPASDSPQPPSRWIVGIAVKPLVPALRSHFDLPDGVGVLVDSVMSGSPAAKVGIKQNDIVVSANERKISSLEDLRNLVEKAGDDGKPVHMEVIHRGKRYIAKMEPAESGDDIAKTSEDELTIMALQRRLDQQQRQIQTLRREVEVLREKLNRE